MFSEKARKIADAILYEGYLLYPYRASALKNRQRFNFGVVGPNGDLGFQILIGAPAKTVVAVKLRFLHLQTRQVVNERGECVAHLKSNGEIFQTWQEASEREVDVQIRLGDERASRDFSFAAESGETILNDGGAKIRRSIEPVAGNLEIEVEKRAENLFRLNVRIFNSSETVEAAALSRSFVSTHTLLRIDGGEFISLLEFPDELAGEVGKLKQNGLFPVLIAPFEMLASPIILYDFPIVAPESDGDFYDATEIDELLILRILTMTDNEKREAAQLDPRAAKILAQAENADLGNLHGAWRSLEQLEKVVAERGSETLRKLKISQKVVLKPKPRGDVFDLVLAGKTATIIRLETDYEDKMHVVVTVDDDDGKDFGAGKSVAHQFFFGAEEVEIIDE